MAHVREVARKSGIAYEVRWRDGGRERQATFKVKRQAERHALNVESEQSAGRATEPLTSRGKTFAEVTASSLESSRARLKPGTLAQYEALYAKRILPSFGKLRISHITSERIEAWLRSLTGERLAPNTVHNHFVAVSKVFRYAERHRLIGHNPCSAVVLPKNERAEDFAPVFLSAQQVEGIGRELAGHQPYDVLVRFAAYTGLRASEIVGLRVRDLNFTQGHIEVRQTVKRINSVWTTGTPKSRRSTRDVPLVHRGLIADLRRLMLDHPNSGDPDALFWPGRGAHSHILDYSQPMNVGGVLRYYLRPALARAGMPQMRFHDLRHTYASLMLAAGFKPYEVSRWMGHASVSTTDGIYAHLYPNDYNTQIAQFEAFVTGANGTPSSLVETVRTSS